METGSAAQEPRSPNSADEEVRTQASRDELPGRQQALEVLFLKLFDFQNHDQCGCIPPDCTAMEDGSWPPDSASLIIRRSSSKNSKIATLKAKRYNKHTNPPVSLWDRTWVWRLGPARITMYQSGSRSRLCQNTPICA